jgi:protein-disulfide isomerase-like protein with CxxC motif
MSNLEGKKLPTVEQVETIIAEYGSRSVEEFADRFELDKVVVEATIESLKRLRRSSGEETVPAIACYRDDNLDSIIRCAGSKHGYV